MYLSKYHYNHGRILGNYQIFQQNEYKELFFTFVLINKLKCYNYLMLMK